MAENKTLALRVTLWDKGGMTKLSEYVSARPDMKLAQFARQLGISRPYLYSLMDGTRFPRLAVALRIQSETGGAVTIKDWPNLAAVIEASEGTT